MLNLSLTLLKDQNARGDWAQSSEFGDNQISESWVLCWVNYHQLATTGCSTILKPIAFCSYLSQTFESLDVISNLSYGWFKIINLKQCSNILGHPVDTKFHYKFTSSQVATFIPQAAS